jgi:hypothetical protein
MTAMWTRSLRLPNSGARPCTIPEFLRGIKAPLAWAYRRSRPPIPTDRDHLFRSVATSVARVLTTPLDDGGEVILLMAGQAQRGPSR